MKVTCLKGNLFKLLKNKLFIVFLSLIAVGCGGAENNNGSGQSPTPLTCADNADVCSPPHLTALYGGGVFYFNEATEINQTVKISEGEKQTFYAIIHDSDISSGESINVTINSTIKLDTNTTDSLYGYISPPLKMDLESIPSALENYTNAEGYEIFNFTLGEDLLLDDKVVGEHEILVVSIDTQGLEGSSKIVVVIENVNDTPVISSLKRSGGVISSGENIFEVYEGGEEGTIRVAVRDVDIPHGDIIGLNITSANLPTGIISIEADKLSQSDVVNNQVEFVVHIASGLLRDADIGEHLLNFLVYDEFGGAEDTRTITLKVNNVVEQPNIISVLAGAGVSAAASDNSWILSEDIAGSLSIVVEDEDFGSVQNQESLRIDIRSSTLPENFITVQQSEISRPDSSTNNRVTFRIEFTAPANGLVGEHNVTFSFTDTDENTALYKREFRIENVNDVPVISALTSLDGVISSGENIFEVYEGGEEGIIRVKVRDVDIPHGDVVGLNITSANLPTGIISIEKDKLSQSDATNNQVEFVVHIASGLLRDADIGEYLLDLLVYDEFGGAEDIRAITLKVNNVVEQPNIISVLAGAGVSASTDDISWILSEDVAGSLSIVVEDEDFGSVQNQESINITITSPTLPENFITVQQSEISSPDSSTNNRATFRIEFTAPANQLVGEHNITFSFTDTDGNTALYKREFRIENVNDAPVIFSLTRSDGVISSGENIFEAFEGGEEGTIRVVVADEDIPHGDVVGLNITSANLPTGIISIEKDKLSQSDATNNQVEFVVHIASGLLRDADIGEHLLNFLVYDEFGGAEDTRAITLKVNNVVEQPNIISVLAGAGVSASADDISWILSEDVAGSLSIVVEDEDFGSVQNQESINITITSPTLPENFITVPQSEISRPDSSTNNRATFRIEFTTPTNQLVGEHNVTFSFTDTDGNTALYEGEFRIENVNDAPVISTLTSLDGVFSSGENIFEAFEGGEEGTIRVAVRDDDIPHGDVVGLNITSANLPTGIISIEADKLSQSDVVNNQVEFVVHIASGLLRDADIGEHLLNFLVYDEFGGAEDTRTITLKVNNVVEQPNIISVLAGTGVSASADGSSWILSEDVAGSLSVVVEDEDLGSVQNQESINITITSPTLPENFITVQQSEISRPDSSTNNRVTFRIEFTAPTNQLVGEHNVTFSFTDTDENTALYKREFRIENVNDVPVISALTSLDGVISSGENIFEVYEGGEEGTIRVAVRDVDIPHGDIIGLNITSANLPTGIISIEADKLSQSDVVNNQVEFVVHIASGLLRDADIGEHLLNFLVYDEFGGAEDTRTITLKVNNVVEQPNIISVLAGTGISASADGNSWILSEDVAGSLSIVVEDEDFGSVQNQESINITITSPTLPENLITVQQSEISRPDSSTNNRVTFRIEFTAPANQLVGEHNVTFSFTDTDGNTALYEGEFRIKNANDAPVIFSLTRSDGVFSSGENIFEAFEGGEEGTIRVAVRDDDIPHGDIVGLNITSANLPAGIISIEKDKLSQSDTINNQVEFVVHIAPGLLRDADIGEHLLNFLVYDEFGGAEDSRTVTLKVINIDDASSANYLEISGMVNKLDSVDGASDTFAISEGQSGQIKIAISDEDLIHSSQLEYAITGDSIRQGIRAGLLNITRVEPSSSAEEHIFLIDIGKSGSPIDDADIGSYNLNLRVENDAGTVNANYPFILKVNNVVEQPNIISVLAGTGISAAASDNSWILSEDVAGSLSIVVEDEDFGSTENQESINMTIMSPTLPKNLITVQQSEISRPDSSTNNRVTFRIEFTAPANELVGEHNITFSFTDIDGNTALYEGKFRIENVNDAPEVYMMDSARGVTSSGENIFEAFEGGEEGIIRVKVRDVDIQHGDIVSLNLISADLPGIISIEEDKLSQSDAMNNQVEFVLNVASGLLRDADIGEHQFRFLVHDEFGGIDGSGNFTLNVKNTDDTSSINYFRINGDINKLDSVDGSPDTFAISEGQSGQIQVIISDEDLIHSSQLEYTITGNSIRQGIRAGLLNITRVESSSSSEEHTFFINIGKSGSPIDDADIGNYNLNLRIFDAGADRRADALYPFVLEINNVPEPTNLINVQAGQGAVAGTGTNYFVLTEKILASLDIIVMDEDLVNPLAQENITMETIPSDLPNDLLLTKSLYVTRPDIVGGNQATFTLEIAAPRNEDARDDNYTIPFIISGAGGRSLVGEISIRIENVNDAPVISALTHSGGVGRTGLPVESNTFIVSEGGVNGAIIITVEDPDIQHGDTVSLDIINDALLGGSAFIDKYFSVESSIAGTNQVEFTIHIASGLMQEIDIGEYHFQLVVFDDFGGSATRDFIVIVEDTDDLTTISNFGWTGNLTKVAPISSPAPSNGGDLFTIYEGQSGQIEFTFSDEDLSLASLVVSNITGNPIDSQIINATIRTKPSSPDERILTINIGNNSSGTQKIDDMHIGTYELSLNISSSAGEAAINYPFTLQIINVEEQPRIIKILPSFGLSSTPAANSFILTQDVATTFIIVVEDEDFASPQNQENIRIVASHPTDPNYPFLTLLSYESPQINLPDIAGGKRADFVAKIAAPSNDFVGEHTLSITAIDSSARTAHLDLNLTILNVNDAPRIINITSSGSVRRSSVNNFVVAEGASPEGSIDVIVEDVDFLVRDRVSLTVASATLDAKFISIAKAHTDESDADSKHQVIFNIDIPSESLNDAEVGTYILEINATDAEGVIATRQVNLVVENVNDAPEIVNITHAGDISKTLLGGEDYIYELNEGSSGVLHIKIADEDLVHSHESITVSWTNPLTRELLSFEKTSFSSTDVLEDGTVTLVLRLGQGADFDDVHINGYIIDLSIFDSAGEKVDAIESSILLEIVNVPEHPFFPQLNHHIAVFEQSGADQLPAGTVIATVGQEYCSVVGSTSGCGSPPPVLVANDPDLGDAARLIYEIGSVGAEKFYVDGLQIKNRIPLIVDSQASFFINAIDPSGMKVAPSTEAIVTVHVKGTNNLTQDFDGDGVRDPYDGAPTNPAAQTKGSGTRADPYLIHNTYQLQAIAGVDHLGNSLQASEFTRNSYLYGNGLLGQLSSHYRLANNVIASITSTWNDGGGFTSIGVGACDGGTQQCDASTAARRVSGSPARFSGIFNGSNFEISGLTINRQSSYIGLFGEAGDGSIISNLRLTSANIINPATRSSPSEAVKFSHGGVLVGQMLGGTIDNVHTTGTLTGVGYRYGGVAGTLGPSASLGIPGIITNSMADVDITANGAGFGGLVGLLGGNSFIHASNAKGDVRSVVNDNRGLILDEAGNLIGFSFGDIFASETGGLVGVSYGNIFASYALGDVHGFHYMGGLVGIAQHGKTTASFAAGDVEGVKNVGGLFGAVLRGTHEHLYYSGQLVRSSYVSELSDSIGGIVGKIEKSPTIHSVINMRSSYPNDEIWKGGLIFGRIDMRSPTTRPQIYDAYSIDAYHTIDSPNRYLGYLLHNDYSAGAVPFSVLGDKHSTIKLLLERQLRDCGIDRTSPGDTSGCRDIFPENSWGEQVASSIDSYFTVKWVFLNGGFPTLIVQPVEYWHVDGTPRRGSSIVPSHEEQRCYIEPAYTHATYCPTTIR